MSVVDGESTAIWGDRWIADHFDARPVTPRVAGHSNLVSELLTASGSWNAEAVRALLLPIDATAIM
jgi:hypothetical protein